jgi:hypothetical protein
MPSVVENSTDIIQVVGTYHQIGIDDIDIIIATLSSSGQVTAWAVPQDNHLSTGSDNSTDVQSPITLTDSSFKQITGFRGPGVSNWQSHYDQLNSIPFCGITTDNELKCYGFYYDSVNYVRSWKSLSVPTYLSDTGKFVRVDGFARLGTSSDLEWACAIDTISKVYCWSLMDSSTNFSVPGFVAKKIPVAP